MEIIKKQYTKPRPILYLYRGMPEASLVSNDFNTATGITLNQQMNEVATLNFQIPFTAERKLSVDDCEKLVKFEGEYYIIKSIDTEDSTSATMNVSCQHESTELKGVYCSYIDLAGASPEEMFNKIMSSTMHPVNTGYKWAGTDVEPSKKRHLITDNEQSVYENLVDMAEVFNGWLEFYTDSNEQKWIFLRTKSIDSKKWIKKGLDMKSLNITYSSEEIFTRLYPLGASDSVTGEELNIIGVNPTGKSYIENYSYYMAKGIPTSVIDKEAKYQQLKIMTVSDYTDAKELYDFAVEELEKYCYPQLDATLTMSDLSVYVDSLDIPPMIGYDIKCVNKDIDFILGCMITGIERNYDSPMDTQITISNLVRYDTFFQKLEHSADTTDKVIGSDEDGNYIPADKVKDGDHINIAYTIGNHTTQITETGKKIELLAEDVEGNKATLTVQAGQISSLVKDVEGNYTAITQTNKKIESVVKDVEGNKTTISQQAGQISTLVQDVQGNSTAITQQAGRISTLVQDVNGAKTEINQLAGKIESKVSLKQVWSAIEQNPDRIVATIHDETDNSVTLDKNGLTVTDGGFKFEDSRGDSVIQAIPSGGVRIGKNTSSGWRSVMIGNNFFEQYLTISNLIINDHLDMERSNIENVGKLFCKYGEVNGSFHVDRTLYTENLEVVGGSKNCRVSTDNYGDRLINAYETAGYFFGDIGSAIIGEEGNVYIAIDPIFLECVNTDCEYHVFTQIYDSQYKINKIDRFENYFVVYGDVGTNFSWEIKAKRKGFENSRLELGEVRTDNEEVN